MVGEQPSLWSKLELKFWVKNEEEEYEHMNQWTSGRIQDLLEVLTMRRLQAVEQLTLGFRWDVSWQDCIHLLQVIPICPKVVPQEFGFFGAHPTHPSFGRGAGGKTGQV